MTEGLTPREKRTIAEQAELLRGLRDRLSKVERAQDTRWTTIKQGEGPKIVDEHGNVVGEIGGQDGLYGHSDRTKPPAPSAPLVEGGAGFLRVTIVEGSEPRDAKLYVIHASTEQGYQVNPGTSVGSILPGDSSVTINLPGGIYHVRAQWKSLAGVHSDASEPVTVEVSPLVDEERIQEVLDEAQERIDEAREWADERFAEMDERAVEAQNAIEQAQQAVTGLESLLETYPDPRSIEESVEAIGQALEQVGNLDTRLSDAETLIETKAQEAAQNLADLDDQLTTAFGTQLQSVLDALSGAGRTWSQATPPPAGTTYEWAGTPHASESIKRVDGVEVARNIATDPRFRSSPIYSQEHDSGELVNTTSSNIWRTIHWSGPLEGVTRRTLLVQYASAPSVAQIEVLPYFYGNTGYPATPTFSGSGTWRHIYDDADGRPTSTPTLRVSPTSPGESLRVRVAVIPGEYEGEHFDGDTLDDRQNDLWINSNGTQHRWDENTKTWVAFTNEQIQQAVDEALSKSDAALTMAGSKNSWLYGTTPPSFNGVVAGDYYSQRDAQRNIIGTWRWNGSTWQSEVLSDSVLGNVSVGKLTAGSVTTPKAVIDKLLADGITANMLEVARATVAARNLAPSMTDEAGWTLSGTASFEPRTQSSSGRAIRMTPTGTSGISGMARSSVIDVNPGDQLKMSTALGRIGNSLATGGRWYMGLESVDPTTGNGTGDTWALSFSTISADWGTVREEVVTVPEGVTKARIKLMLNGDNSDGSGLAQNAHTTFYDVRVTNMVDGSLVVENSITADKIIATSELVTKIIGADVALVNDMLVNGHLFANHATFINAALQSLTVTEKANFADAFADSFMANSAVIGELLTSRLVVSAENFAPDPGLVPEAWDLIGADVVSNSNSATGNAIRFGQRSGDTQVRGPMRPVRPGDAIRFRGYYSWIGGSNVGAPVQLRMEWFKDPKGSRQSLTTFHTISNNSPADWVEAEVTVPEGITWARLYLYQASTTATNKAVIHGDMDVRSKLGGHLIVPGTIETEHLNVTEEMVATLLQAKKIEAGEIAGNAFEGGTFTGGIFDGSVVRGGRFETHEAENQGVKITPSGVIQAFNTNGDQVFAVGGAFNSFGGRISAYEAPNLPRITLKPAGEAQSGGGTTNAGVFFIRDGSSGIPGLSSVAGVYVMNPASTGAEPLMLKGMNGGAVEVATGSTFHARGESHLWGGTDFRGGNAVRLINASGQVRVNINDTYAVFSNNVTVQDNFSIQSPRTTTLAVNTHLDSNGIFYRNTSASRFKIDQQVVDVPDEILTLDVKDWVDKHALDRRDAAQAKKDRGEELDHTDEADLTPDMERVTGLIAEDVEAIDPRYVTYDEQGRVEGLNYTALSLTWLPIVRRQRDRIDDLEATVSNLEARLAALEANQS